MLIQPWFRREGRGGGGDGEGGIITTTTQWIWDSAHCSLRNTDSELPRNLLISSDRKWSVSAYWERMVTDGRI